MKADVIMNAGIDELKEMREQVLRFDESRNKSKTLTDELLKLEKAIKLKEKNVNEEVSVVLKKRKQDIEESFDAEETRLKTRKKKIEASKGKNKGIKVSERIKEETAEIHKELIEQKREGKQALKESGLPFTLNNALIYALFYTKRFGDYLILAVIMLIAYLAIPYTIMYFVPWDYEWVNALIAFACVLLFRGIYTLIGRATKGRHSEGFTKGCEIKQKRIDTIKKLKKLEKSIRSDKDESKYDLKQFNDELNDITEALKTLATEKEAALTQFEASTKTIISDEIRKRRKEEIDALKSSYDTAYNEQREAESISQKMAIEISSKYEVFLGKAVVNLAFIDKMLEQMETGAATTISEAIELAKKSDSDKKKKDKNEESVGSEETSATSETDTDKEKTE